MSEDMIFCGTTCLAARHMGMGLRKDADAFTWFDPLGHRFSGEPNPDPQLALKSACETLVNKIQL